MQSGQFYLYILYIAIEVPGETPSGREFKWMFLLELCVKCEILARCGTLRNAARKFAPIDGAATPLH